jgi:hypothetical protein
MKRGAFHPREELASPETPSAPSAETASDALGRNLPARFLLKTFWDWADWFLFWTGANLVAACFCLTVVGAPFGLGGIFAVASKVARAEEPGWSDFWRGVRQCWLGAFVWLVALAGALGSLLAGIFFYPALLGLGGYFVAGLNLWLCLGVVAALLYAPGGVALKDMRWLPALRLGAFLALAHPFQAFFVLAWALVWAAATAGAFPIMVPFVSLALAGAGLMAAWTVVARPHLEAMAKAKALAENPTPPTPKKAKPASWKEIKQSREQAELDKKALFLERDEMARSFGELLRPWEM